MGYDLVNSQGGFSLNIWNHSAILRLAWIFGWNPKGTICPEIQWNEPEENWSGTYLSNDFQIVSLDDAENLHTALSKAIQFIEGVKENGGSLPRNDITMFRELPDLQECSASNNPLPTYVKEIVSNSHSTTLKSLEALCCHLGPNTFTLSPSYESLHSDTERALISRWFNNDDLDFLRGFGDFIVGGFMIC